MKPLNGASVVVWAGGLLVSGALTGCGSADLGTTEAGDIGSTSAPVVVTNCTGAAISAAIAAGGNVDLNCGSSPITIAMPPTTVTMTTRVRPVSSGPITFTHMGPLFSVRNNASFELDNINLAGSGSMAIHCLSASATVSGVTATGYLSFVLTGHVGSRLTVINSTFSQNGSASMTFGAPIYGEGSSVDVRGSTFFGNQGVSGAAITAFGGTLSVADSTFYFNMSSSGAIYARSNSPSITNSTFWRNTASSQVGAVNAPTSTTIRNCTFADNGAPLGSLAAGMQSFNSILLDTLSPPTATCQLAGTGNIEWPPTLRNCGVGFRYGDPNLGMLASNGGPTQTMALQPASAAIDSAVSPCPTFDQRGVFRPRDGDANGFAVCDVGAFER
jgi:hypothetical protein